MTSPLPSAGTFQRHATALDQWATSITLRVEVWEGIRASAQVCGERLQQAWKTATGAVQAHRLGLIEQRLPAVIDACVKCAHGLQRLASQARDAAWATRRIEAERAAVHQEQRRALATTTASGVPSASVSADLHELARRLAQLDATQLRLANAWLDGCGALRQQLDEAAQSIEQHFVEATEPIDLRGVLDGRRNHDLPSPTTGTNLAGSVATAWYLTNRWWQLLATTWVGPSVTAAGLQPFGRFIAPDDAPTLGPQSRPSAVANAMAHPRLAPPTGQFRDWSRLDATNRTRLEELLATTEADLAALDRQLPNLSGHGDTATERARTDAIRQLRALDDVARILDAPTLAGQDVFLLSLSADDPNRLVLAVGDLANAQRVDVLVPGTGAGAASLGGYVAAERALHRREHRSQPTRSSDDPAKTAQVVFVDYSAPQNLVQAAGASRAIHGGHRLAQLLADIRTVNPGARVTVTGHSYGSTVVGAAMQHPQTHVDTAILVASPGALADNAAGLVGADCVVALTSPNDVIGSVADTSWTATLGGDPAADGFGAKVFDVPVDPRLWHSYDGYVTHPDTADTLVAVRSGAMACR